MDLYALQDHKKELQQRRERLVADLQAVQKLQSHLTSQIRREQLQRAVFYSQRQSRMITDRTPLDRWFFIAMLPVVVAAICFILTDVITGNRSFSAFAGIFTSGTAFAVLTLLLKKGDDLQLEPRLYESRMLSNQLLGHQQDNARQISYLQEELGNCETQLRLMTAQLIDAKVKTSKEHILQNLYRRNWKSLRDVEFEGFLEEVLKAQGYVVETTSVTGDQGVDLVVARHGTRIAIQVKGYHSSVGNAAIQQAYAGMAHYRCQACAVITNSRFTTGAAELAKSTNCLLIDEDSFRDFVMGRLDLIPSTTH